MTLRRVEGPIEAALTLAEAKEHLRVTDSAEDAMIARLIDAATSHVEQYTGRPLIRQKWEKKLDAFPLLGDAIELAKPPVISVDSVIYRDESGVQQTLSPECYELDAQSETAWLVTTPGFIWPLAYARINAVTIAFSAGWIAAGVLPSDIKAALLLLIGHLFENREAVIVDARVQAFELPMGVEMLLSPYRLLRFA